MYRPDEVFVHDIDTWIKNHEEAFIRDIDRLVAIPSISEQGDPIYPFGKHCAEALDEVTALAGEYGLKVENHEYYCGSCLVKGSAEHPKRIGLFAHLDIVPPGEGWQYPPLKCTQKDGFLIGRGVGDNKGPGICALYAVRFLKEYGICFKNDVLVYFGLSEETGMQDIRYFCQNQQIPDLSLVTDTNFPVCYGEKGLLRIDIERSVNGNLKSFHAGKAVNVIPSDAEAVVTDINPEAIREQIRLMSSVSFTQLGNNGTITATGISKHAAFPEGAVNAVQVLADALAVMGILEADSLEAVKAISVLTRDFYGVGAAIPFEDETSGKLTCVLSMVRMENRMLTISFDIRYPVTVRGEEVLTAFQKRIESLGFHIKRSEMSEPAYVPPEHPVIPVLCDICDYVQGTHYEPYTMGGGTYARHLPLSVGYGPGVPDMPNPFGIGHGQGHQPDECIPLAVLLKGLKTYILTLLELDNKI